MSKQTSSKGRGTKVTLNRSSVTGRFVTEGYAKRHPKTTQTEKR